MPQPFEQSLVGIAMRYSDDQSENSYFAAFGSEMALIAWQHSRHLVDYCELKSGRD